DRLLLGMKGTMSLFRQRSQEALRQKARRGALFLGVAAGYVKTGRDRIEKAPDQQVRAAVGIVFAKFAELQSVRQVHVWLREEGIALPTAPQCGGGAHRRLAVAALQHRARHPDQPRLRRRVCFRANHEQGQRGGGPQAREARHAPPTGRMGRAAQGPARGLYLLDGVREESEGDRRQCDGQGRRRRQRSGATRRVASRRSSALWPLRSQNVRGLWRQGGTLSLRRRSREPRRRAL